MAFCTILHNFQHFLGNFGLGSLSWAKNTGGGFICRCPAEKTLPGGENNEESCGRHSLVHCSPADTHDDDDDDNDDDDEDKDYHDDDDDGGDDDDNAQCALLTTPHKGLRLSSRL